MHPVLTQEMARQHREELLRRATIERAALHLIEQENSKGFRRVFAFLEPLHDMSTILSRRLVIIQQRKYSDIDFDEIKHELQVTFAAMRKLRSELPSAGELLLVRIPTPGQRLLLAVVIAGILASSLGMMMGISQGILLGVSLLCFVIVAVGIVLRSI